MDNQENQFVMIAIDGVLRDRLKVHAAQIKKSMKEIIDALVGEYLQKVGE